jgi:hypothetical protein
MNVSQENYFLPPLEDDPELTDLDPPPPDDLPAEPPLRTDDLEEDGAL